MPKTPRIECSTPLSECNTTSVCACGCGEPFGPTYTGRNRFKRGHYRFIPDQHTVDPESGCWLWQGPVAKRSGHGVARNDQGKTEHAHRLYYEALVRPLADDEIAYQMCGKRLCCNPDHIQVVAKGDAQRHLIQQQWQRQLERPDEHHIGPRHKEAAA